MTLKQFFIEELGREAPVTRKMLERVPGDKFDWKPHDKSMLLGKLAAHVATLPVFIKTVLTTDSLDIGTFRSPSNPETAEALLTSFDAERAGAQAALEAADENEFDKPWSMTYQGNTMLSMSKAQVIQTLYFNHAAHHRAQLGVYLRLLDIAIPSTYGPSADEQ